ncbi:fibropellin-3-like [Dreissena polymorpha]|uniref:fibropellin-3-like n=1 Tax=Dreissena polymorpha TaxID=45954 RepID=UPI002264CE71|nr:fibropellin-3-like [Dreissena polymorpha]
MEVKDSVVGFWEKDKGCFEILDKGKEEKRVYGCSFVRRINDHEKTGIISMCAFISVHARDECSSSPCLHGGTCMDGINAYTCICPAGFSGRKCETNIDECASSPCLHCGTCSDGVNGYICTCLAGFSGKECETNIDECASSPCLHCGTCSDGVNGYICTCLAGFSGKECETNGVNAHTCLAGFSEKKCETTSAPFRQLMCYSCDEMSDLKLCDTVQRCARVLLERQHI